MLDPQDGKTDCDGYLALALSLSLIILTCGLGVFVLFVYVWVKATQTSPTSEVHTVLVLGKKLVNDMPDKEFIERLTRVVTVFKKNPTVRIYILGGKTGGTMSESLSGKRFLMDRNIASGSIMIEEKSRHTLENFKNICHLKTISGKPVFMITNRYHMARSLLMAKGFKMNISPYFAEDKFSVGFKSGRKILLEAFFLHFYLVGKYFAVVTKNRRVLKRISTR